MTDWVRCVVVANEGQRIDIPDGCVLENSAFMSISFLTCTVLTRTAIHQGLLSGNLTMTVSEFVPVNPSADILPGTLSMYSPKPGSV